MSSCTYQWKFRYLLIFTSLATLQILIVCCNSPPPEMVKNLVLNNPDSSSPQQVHISLAGKDMMRVSWVTESDIQSIVFYGTSNGKYKYSARGKSITYEYDNYTSGFIHNVVIGPLIPATTYFYQCGKKDRKEFKLRTPPATFPLKFAVVGDLGQTEKTKATLLQIAKSGYNVLLLPGDLTYADSLQHKWDSFGKLVEPLASRKPWMVAAGNHEIEFKPSVHSQRFTAYNARWRTPFRESKSITNEFYSFSVAGAHVIVLASYITFDKNSKQYKWLEADLESVDRTKTPWLIVIIHSPWYNSYKVHRKDYVSVGMKHHMEHMIRKARVDIVFPGTSMHTRDSYEVPKPRISVFREATYGHGQLLLVNETHAKWTWHRNADNQTISRDSVWIESLAFNRDCTVAVAP